MSSNSAPHPSHFLLLYGDTGIGKTRLAEEVSREAQERGWCVVWSRTYEQESSIPYRLWTEAFRKAMIQMNWLHRGQFIVPSLEHFLRVSNLEKNDIHHLSTLLPELHMMLPEVSPIPSSHPDQKLLYVREATLRLLNNLSSRMPLLLVLDDLHWANNSSLELLAYLIRHLHDQRVLLVGTCRDTELQPGHPLHTLIADLTAEGIITPLPVSSLTQTQIGNLVAPAHLPDQLVQYIQTHVAGNPFFAEELAHYSHAELHSGPYDSFQQIALPQTITHVLERRIHQLSDACQRFLSKIAVLGGSFEFTVVRFIEAGSDEETLLNLLEEASHAGVLTEEGTGTHITYHFWHPMIVSYLYENLSAARRTRIHLRAASVLQHLYGDQENEGSAAICHHLLKGGAEPSQIAYYAEQAGDGAYRVSAYPEALKHYQLVVSQ